MISLLERDNPEYAWSFEEQGGNTPGMALSTMSGKVLVMDAVFWVRQPRPPRKWLSVLLEITAAGKWTSVYTAPNRKDETLGRGVGISYSTLKHI